LGHGENALSYQTLFFFSTIVCLRKFKQRLIDQDLFFDQDPDHDEYFDIKVRWKNFHQGLLKNFQSGFGCKKLTRSATVLTAFHRRKFGSGHIFLARVCQKIFNQSLVELEKSKID